MSGNIYFSDYQISKTLSWILRHGAVKEKLPIQSNGFININSLLMHKSFNGKCNIEDIERIVANNDKQRFALRNVNGNLEIRANQGHSLQEIDNLVLKPILKANEVKVIIHGTFYKNWNNIRKNGLCRMNRNHIHFAIGLPTNKQIISSMRSSCEIFIYINAGSVLASGIKLFLSKNNVILSPGNLQGFIKPKHFLKVIDVSSDQNSYDNHLLGSKHQLALHTKNIREKKEKCSIYITGFSNSTKKEDLVKYFSQYDKITDFFPENIERFVIIQFEEEKTVEKLLKTSIYLQGRKLHIKRRVLKDLKETKKPQDDDKAILTKIVHNINSDLVFTFQLKQFIDEVQLPFHITMNIYNHLCTDIQRSLNGKFVNCRVWPFGSTVSGLGFKQSDVDVFIEVLSHPIIQDASSIVTENDRAAVYVKLAKNILYKSNCLFSHVLAIPKAKTPIVKFTHNSTGVNCDMNFKNMLGVCNSRLINFMLNLDTRLRPTMIIIKFWGKIQDISGTGRISNYGLTMMFLFYLQHYPNPIVPPIGWLQTSSTVQFHEGWNGGFCDDLKYLPNIKTANKLTIPELLHGFFQFYSKYDFGFNVICPLIGENIPKTDFTSPENLPEKLFHYKNMLKNKGCEPFKYTSPICIQDPFELSHNITSFVSQRLFEEFQKLCHIARDICLECLINNNNLLKNLFTKQDVSNILGATDDQCIFKMQVNATLNYIDHNNIKAAVEEKSIVLRQLWFEKINQFLISALSKIFLFEITIKKEIQRNKFQKVDGQSDIHDNNTIDTISFHCVGYHNVWDARKSIAKTFNRVDNSNTNFLDLEIAITDYIVNDLCKGVKIAEPIVDFNLEFKSKIDPTEAEFILININCKKNCFCQMANFFANKLPIWFEKWIKQITDEQRNESNLKNIETNNIAPSDNIEVSKKKSNNA